MIKFSKPLIAAVQGAASGSLYSAKLDGSDKKALVVAQGNLTGVAYADLVQAKAAARNDGPRLIP